MRVELRRVDGGGRVRRRHDLFMDKLWLVKYLFHSAKRIRAVARSMLST
jgi:hypothetical protein